MLYQNHIDVCNAFAQSNPANLKRSALFVLATIQQQLETVGAIVADLEQQGTASRFAFGFKANGIDYLNGNIETLYRDAMRARGKPQKLLSVFLRVPGLGIVKAGFLAQIFDNAVGCIDLHNVTLYGVPATALRYSKKTLKPKTKRAKRAGYVGLCASLGGSVALWSRWCDHVAAIRPANWSSGFEVSQYHVDVITGRETGQLSDLFSGVEFNAKWSQVA
jgi:hypothetical protein